MRRRELIVNADDLGRCRQINAGIADAHRWGIVTSASLMVRYPAAAEAATWTRRTPGIGVGLHLDLGEWALQDGVWTAVYEVVALNDADAVEREIRQQVKAFRDFLDDEPTHLDSHQHIHLDERVSPVVDRLGVELGLPVRRRHPRVNYCGGFYGQDRQGEPLPEAIGPERLVALLANLPPGVTELACHPGHGTEHGDPYDAERRVEVASLCDPAVRATVREQGIVLRSFAGLGRRPERPPRQAATYATDLKSSR